MSLPGLDADRSYRVTLLDTGSAPGLTGRVTPGRPPLWVEDPGTTFPGRFLAEAGLPMPVLWSEQALVLHLLAV